MKKLDVQKIFCIISACFILTCIVVYGYRFISLYIENKNSKAESKENSVDNTVGFINDTYEWSNL